MQQVLMQAREYQQSIVDTAKLHNTLVVLPTGLGKTFIALLVAQHRIEQYPRGKVLFLAPTRPLVEQHAKSFAKQLPDAETLSTVLTGKISPDKRKKEFDNATYIFSTPQTVQNDLLTNRIDLKEVCLLVLDEAHRAVGEYAYVYIAQRYQQQSLYERILALTASPGSSKEDIMQVIENTAAEKIEVRSREDPQVAPYVKNMDVKYLEVNFPSTFEEMRSSIQRLIRARLSEVRSYGYISHVDASRTQLLQATKMLQAKLKDGQPEQSVWRSLSVLAEVMKAQHALELIETQGVSALLSYMQGLEGQAAKGQSRAVKSLVSDSLFKKARIHANSLKEKGLEHPKFLKLLALIKVELAKNPDAKFIVFSQYRDMAAKIVSALGIKAKLFVGQQKKGGTGLSQKEQKEIIQQFRDGVFPVLVATAVGEEGLDIPAVDAVIFYEPVPSGIRTIQRRGRTGRQEEGKVFVLLTTNTREVAYRWAAHHKEKRMYRTLKDIATTVSKVKKKEQKKLDDYEQSFVITTDSREKSSPVLKELQNLGVNLEMRALDVGDYVLSKRVCVEYKTANDFVSSMLDGRLMQQLAKMTAYQRPILLIQGSNWYEQRNVHPNAIRGMLSAITVSFGVPIIVAQNEKDAAEILFTIARREAVGGVGAAEFIAAKAHTLKDNALHCIAAMPNVGPVLAQKLLKHFGSVKDLINASEQDLQDIEGIGKKKAKELVSFFSQQFI